LHRTHQKIEVISQACPGFVELVESGPLDRDAALPIVASALHTFKDTEIDTMILGCTHYPLLAKVIGEVLGPRVRLINSAEETARDVSHWLTEHEMTRNDKDVPIHRFYTSGEANRFKEIATMWLGQKIEVSSYDVWDQEERKQKESSCARR
jgi:glutamate racemase